MHKPLRAADNGGNGYDDAKEEEELAKAAEEYAYTNCEDGNYHEGASKGMPFDPIGHAEKTFIAGADWQRAYTASKAKSKSFEEQVKELWDEKNTGHDYIVVHSYNIFYGLCLDIANWQKEQIEKQNENAMQYVKEHHSPSEISDFQAAMNIAVAKAYNAGYTEGYKAGKEECLEPYNKGFEEGKKWQKQKDMRDESDLAVIAALDGAERGKKIMREQIMKDAIEREVKIDAGGYPYIDATELYDYDKDIPLVKAGDKVKVIIMIK